MKRAYTDTPNGQIYFESDGKGEALICLHDANSSSWEFQALMPLLAKNFRVIAPDLLGNGISDPAPAAWNSVEDWAGSVIKLMDILKINKASLFGHRLGSKIAIEVAAAYPARINRLVIAGCGIWAANTGREFDTKSFWPRQVQTTSLPERVALFKKEHKTRPDIPVSGSHLFEMWEFLVRNNKDARPENIQAAFLANFRAYEKRCSFDCGAPNDYAYAVETRARKVKAPTLLITGANDGIQAPVCKDSGAVGKLIPGCKVTAIKGAGMMGPSVHAPEFAAAITKFLAGSK
jgi:pimeloyl-ACP methyl ester carboxylesterase